MTILFGLCLLGLGFWASVAIVAGHYGIGLAPPVPWLWLAQYYLGPWISLIGGFLLWKHARTWRRLHHQRHQPAPLVRGGAWRVPDAERASTLERAGKLAMATGAIALLYWWELHEPEFYLAAGLLVWMVAGLAAGILRRAG